MKKKRTKADIEVKKKRARAYLCERAKDKTSDEADYCITRRVDAKEKFGQYFVTGVPPLSQKENCEMVRKHTGIKYKIKDDPLKSKGCQLCPRKE